MLERNLAALQAPRPQQWQKEVACMGEGHHWPCFLIEGSVMLGCSCRKCLEWEDPSRFGLLGFYIQHEWVSSLELHQKVTRAVENLKEWILHGFETGIRAQDWKMCQASTSGNVDRVHSLLFYLLLLRTFGPYKQDCITRGGGKDQDLLF